MRFFETSVSSTNSDKTSTKNSGKSMSESLGLANNFGRVSAHPCPELSSSALLNILKLFFDLLYFLKVNVFTNRHMMIAK